MSAVVDASVLVAALVDGGPTGPWAEQVLGDGDLHAPEMVRAEAANTLRRLESTGAITTAEADAAFEDLQQLDLQVLPFDPFAQRVWVATLDGRLARSSGPGCRFLMPGG